MNKVVTAKGLIGKTIKKVILDEASSSLSISYLMFDDNSFAMIEANLTMTSGFGYENSTINLNIDKASGTDYNLVKIRYIR